MSRFASVVVLCLLFPSLHADEWKSAGIWKGHPALLSARLEFSADGKKLFLVNGTAVKSFDVAANKEGPALKHRAAVVALHSSDDGKTVTTLTRDGSLCVWDAATAKTKSVIALRVGTVACAGFSPEGKELALFGGTGRVVRNHAVSVWQVPSGKSLGQVVGDASPPREVRLSSQGKSLAVVVDSFHQDKDDPFCLPTNDVRLFDVSSRKLVRTLVKSGQPSFACDGKRIVVTNFDGKGSGGQFVDCSTGQATSRFAGHKDGTRATTLDSSGKCLVSGGQDKLVRVWNAATGKEIASLPGHTAAVVAVACSREGKVIASASEDRTIRIWASKE